jgi:hypothetical protein
MKWLLVALALMIAVAGQARAAEETVPFTGIKLYQVCANHDGGPADGMCLAYVRGLVYGIQYAQRVRKTSDSACLPTKLSPLEARLVLEKFMRDNPRGLSETDGDIVASHALAEAYPCPREAREPKEKDKEKEPAKGAHH